ncbi:MAG: hypothetical protein ACRDJN_03840 [Chloroflexota bacterium]
MAHRIAGIDAGAPVAAPRVPVLLLTGPVRAGKTSVAGEVSARLEQASIPHAVVDMDALRWCYPHPPDDPFGDEQVGLPNLAAVWSNFRAAGATRLVLAHVVGVPRPPRPLPHRHPWRRPGDPRGARASPGDRLRPGVAPPARP